MPIPFSFVVTTGGAIGRRYIDTGLRSAKSASSAHKPEHVNNHVSKRISFAGMRHAERVKYEV